MIKCEVKVVFENQKAKVEFKGIWTRSLIDIARVNMLRQLPIHLATLRERVIIPETIIEEREVI